jgi:DNA-binding XRE family transcriptional regulator|tara:strand:- start:212 stop:553 length:342 start_codon:yes stop_codon:yes gene_type:complete
MEDTIDSLQWIANYYHRQNSISREKLRRLQNMGIEPKHKERKVDSITLPMYIQFLGKQKAAKDWDVSEHTVEAWRYGHRQPSVKQAKKIIKLTDGRLDWESIYGSLEDLIAED